MFIRLISFAGLVWFFGFLWFAVTLPGPTGKMTTDAAIVLTGGKGRIDRGLEVLRKDWAPKLLVSGVDREVLPAEFAAEYDVSGKLMACCVTLGFESYDTRSNAMEALRWLARNDYRSVRLITTDWHMRRAAYEMERVKPRHLVIIRDAVHSDPSLKILFLEYHKWLARRLSGLWEP